MRKSSWSVLVGFAAALGMAGRAEATGAVTAENGISLKVITTKDTKLSKEPEEGARGEPVAAFTILYVLPPTSEAEERRFEKIGEANLARNGFLRVASGPTESEYRGWLPRSDTLLWTHREALGFTPLTTRDRGLFYASREEAEAGFRSADAAARALFKEPASRGNLTMLMPLLDSARLPGAGHDVNLYQLAIMAARKGAEEAAPPVTVDGREVTVDFVRENVTADFVFVVDTTGSMGGPIDQVKASIKKVASTLAREEKLRPLLRFGLVAYRDAEDPGADGYAVRTYCTLPEGKDPAVFLERLDQLTADAGGNAAEDVLAGLKDAMDPSMGWNPVGFKQVILVGDASAREPGHPQEDSRTNFYGQTIPEVMRLAQPEAAVGTAQALMKVFQISAVHIYNPDPAYQEDNAVAESQFRTLAKEARLFKGKFISVEGGTDAKDFSTELANHLVESTRSTLHLVKEGRPASPVGPSGIPTIRAPGPDGGGADRPEVPYPVLELIRALPGGDEGSAVPTFQKTFATEYDAAGNQVLVVHVLVVRDELENFVNILKVLVSQLRKNMGSEKNVARVVDSMKRVSAEVTTADAFTEDTNLDRIFQGVLKVPLKTPIFNKSIRGIMGMSDSSFQEWLRQAEECQKQLEGILDRESAWFSLHKVAHKSQQHSFVSLGDLP